MLLAEAGQAPVVDYYAGAIAFLTVTMFARYAIHKTKERAPEQEDRAKFWHKTCVNGSAVGIVLALAVLGFDETSWLGRGEYVPRALVGIAAILAAAVLAFDISTTPAITKKTGKTRTGRAGIPSSTKAPDALSTKTDAPSAANGRSVST